MAFIVKPAYASPHLRGLLFVGSRGDGYGVELKWERAYSLTANFNVVYNMYFSTIREDVFTEGVKFVAIDPEQTIAILTGFRPGDVFFFAVRAALHDTTITNLNQLPEAANGCKIYPESMLLAAISEDDLRIPVSDIDIFPANGVVQIGFELINYTSIDIPNNELVVPVNGRGFYTTNARLHQPDGYDGYVTHENPLVRFWTGFSDQNTSVQTVESKFSEPNYARTDLDGYAAITKDNLTTDLSASDEQQQDFAVFDFAGWRRTDPVLLLRGDCVASYYGGQHYCADGYGGVGQQIRGLGINEINNQRQEVLLSTDGEAVVLVRRMFTGARSKFVNSSREHPAHRATDAFGAHLVTGYEQFYNPRRSDGRILVRFDPAVEDLIPQDSGLESDYKPNSWTMVFPAIKDRDFLVRFNQDGTEGFRYEVANVTRNKILLDDFGAQKMALIRVRKTDPIYQFPIFADTSTMPMELNTTIGFTPGPGGVPPHSHVIVVNEGITMLSQINQVTGISQGHNHVVENGQFVPNDLLGHSHSIILP